MDDLWRAIAALAMALHQDRIEALASSVEKMKSAVEVGKCTAAIGPMADSSLLEQLKHAWSANQLVSGAEVASALRAAGSTAALIAADESVDLVWTGPGTSLIPTRKTEQVIREIIDGAMESLFVVSYVFVNASGVVDSLNDAVGRGVAVRILLESHSDHGGTVSIDGLSSMRRAVPAAELYIWNSAEKNKSTGRLSAAVHAKCTVADHKFAFITSANLTAAALERNMELGVMLRGGTLPSRLHSHLNALISTSIISAWRG